MAIKTDEYSIARISNALGIDYKLVGTVRRRSGDCYYVIDDIRYRRTIHVPMWLAPAFWSQQIERERHQW
jgi:hypothetical protein